MTNNLQVKDANNVTKEIHTIEDSTSAHYNMSIPITVSGIPIFTTAAPGVVSLADSVVGVSISPTQANIPVSITPLVFNVPVSLANTNVNVSLEGGPTFSTPGSDNISSGVRTLYTTNFNYVYDTAGTNWDRWDGKVSVGNTTPITVSIGAQTSPIGVSLAPPTFNIPVSVHPVTQSGTWNIGALTSLNSIVRVSVVNIADVSIQDNAPVSVRGGVLGAVSLGGGTAQIGSVVNAAGTNLMGAVSVRQIVSVQPDGTANWPVSIAPPTFNVPVSLAAGRVSVQGIADVSIQDNAPVSVRGGVLGAVSLGGGLAQIGRVSVFVDQTPFNVSISPAIAPIPVSVVAGRVSIQGISQVSVAGAVTVAPLTNTAAAVPAGAFFVGGTDGTNLRGLLTDTTGALAITSIKDDVSIAPQTLFVHVCNTAPGGASGSTQMVSVGGAVSLQAVQIAVRDTGGDARTPLANTVGNLLVHVCNSLPAASGITQLVSVGGAVSTQAVQIAYRDTGGDARTPLTNTIGNILVHVCNAAPGAAGGSSITTSIGGPVSVQAVPIAGVDTGGNVRQPLMTTGGALIVHVSNTAPGGSTGGSTPQVSVGGAVSVQGNQVVGVDEDGLARTLHVNTSGVQYISTRTFMTQAVFTRPADTTAYAAGATAAPGNAGDLIANSTTAGSVVPLKFKVSRGNNGVAYIRGARLYRSGGTLATGQHAITGNIRLHLFNAASGVSVVNGDNGAFLASPVSNWMGYIDLTPIASAPGLRTGTGVSVQVYWGAPARTGEMIVPLAATQVSIQGLLETRVAFTPIASEIFTVQLDGFNG